MSSFGEELKRERELRQITLREVSEATKINLRYLDALERNDFEHLPGGVFNRGFVRAFSQYIGVDPEAMVNAYLLEERALLERTGNTALSPDPDVFRPQQETAPSEDAAERDRRRLRVRRIVVVSAAAALAVLVAAVVFWLVIDREPSAPSRPPGPTAASGPESGLAAATEPATDSGTTETAGRDRPESATPAPPVTLAAAAPPTEKPRGSDRQRGEEEEEEAGEEPSPGQPPEDRERPVVPSGPTEIERQSPEPQEIPPEAEPETEATPVAGAQSAGTAFRVLLRRTTLGRLNCDNRRVEILDGMSPGTDITLHCRSYLMVSAADGGAVLVGVAQAEPTPAGTDGVAIEGLTFVPPAAEIGDSSE